MVLYIYFQMVRLEFITRNTNFKVIIKIEKIKIVAEGLGSEK